MRMKRMAAGAATMVVVATTSVASLTAIASGDTQDQCSGLACAVPDTTNAVPEARGPVTPVPTASDLSRAQASGFYEFDPGTAPNQRAVAYVIKQGTLDSVLASVRRLPVLRASASESGLAKYSTI